MNYQQLWAPWRLGYIQGEPEAQPTRPERFSVPGADPECFICQAVADSSNPARHVVHRGGVVLSLLNRYPYNNGHLLVAPHVHCGQLHQLDDQQMLALSREIRDMLGLLERVLKPEGFNVGLNLGHVAGAGLPGHLHWHIVPRWTGDTNFLPALAGVKVIPQSLDALWELLLAESHKHA